MNKKVLFGAAIGLVIFLVFILGKNGESTEDHKKKVEKERLDKSRFMKESRDSPFVSDPDSFTKLSYFPIDEKFKVTAEIEKIETRSYVNIGTSDGQLDKHFKFAYAKFKLDDIPYKLLLLKPVKTDKRNYIFTAFADDTSGETTYGGGRYLDLSFSNAQYITLDFNLAYNPYCAYNGDFSCPLPPSENNLPIAIPAGEKNYHEE